MQGKATLVGSWWFKRIRLDVPHDVTPFFPCLKFSGGEKLTAFQASFLDCLWSCLPFNLNEATARDWLKTKKMQRSHYSAQVPVDGGRHSVPLPPLRKSLRCHKALEPGADISMEGSLIPLFLHDLFWGTSKIPNPISPGSMDAKKSQPFKKSQSDTCFVSHLTLLLATKRNKNGFGFFVFN